MQTYNVLVLGFLGSEEIEADSPEQAAEIMAGKKIGRHNPIPRVVQVMVDEVWYQVDIEIKLTAREKTNV